MGGGWFLVEIEEASSSRACLWLGEVGCIIVNPEVHLAGNKSNFGIGMSGCVVKKPMIQKVRSFFCADVMLVAMELMAASMA